MVEQKLLSHEGEIWVSNSKGYPYRVSLGRNVRKSQLKKGAIVNVDFHNRRGYITGVL